MYLLLYLQDEIMYDSSYTMVILGVKIQIKYQGITNLKEDIEIYVMITNGNGFLVPLEPSVDGLVDFLD